MPVSQIKDSIPVAERIATASPADVDVRPRLLQRCRRVFDPAAGAALAQYRLPAVAVTGRFQ